MTVTVLYFAWMRERVGTDQETLDLPQTVVTVSDLIEHLKHQSAGHSSAFENTALIRVALDQDHATLESPLGSAQEIAFFPPVTGG